MSSTDRARTGSAAAYRGEANLRLALRHGGTTSISLSYELVGEGSRLLIVGGGISAGRHAISSAEFAEPGWWESQTRTFDLSRYRLLAIDWVGADGATDLPIDASDQADAIAALLKYLGIAQAEAFIGASYGGMVALHFAARYADLCAAILIISASASSHPFASACRSLQRRALSLGDGAAGVALARAMAMLTYRTPVEFGERFDQPPVVRDGQVRVAAEDYLDHHGRRHVERMSATAYRRLSESIDLHRIDPAEVRVRASFAGVDSDALVPLRDVEALAAAIPDARFHLIHSKFGHDAFLKEGGQIAAIVTEFLQSLEAHA